MKKRTIKGLTIKFKALRNRNIFIYVIVFFTFYTASAQSSWNDILEREKGVIVEQKQDVEINVTEDGKLEIIAHLYEETQHFSENANLYREQSIGYSNTFTEISDIEAYSLIPNNNKFKKILVNDFVTSDSRSSGIFYDDQKKISYVFPALSAGAKTVTSYTKKYKEPRLWGYYMFSSYFPVEKSEFTVKAPVNVKLNFFKYGLADEKVKFTEIKKGKYNIFTWSADHLDKIQMSKGADGVLHTALHLIIHVDSYEVNGKTTNVLGNVEDLHSWYTKFLDGLDEGNSEDMKQMVDNIISGKSTELEKVEAIYDWVQQNIKYIAIEDGLGGFRPRASNTVFSRRYGDCKDMSNLIHNMLGLANIPSSLTWIGTTAIPYTHREVPTPMADNHMICTYVNKGKYYFLDATDQYNILGVPTSHIQGKEAMINKGNTDFELVNVPVISAEQNSIIDSVNLNIEQDKIVGYGKVVYAGYNKTPVLNSLENLSEKDKKDFLNMLLKKGNNKFLLSSVATEHLSQKSNDLIVNYDFTVEDYVQRTADEIFINPHLSKPLEGGLITLGATEQDIHYDYKRLTSNIFCIKIPESYSLSYLPKNAKYDGGDFGFSIDYEVKGNTIFVHQKVEINTLLLKTGEFESWNKMVKGLFSAYKESVVLGKN